LLQEHAGADLRDQFPRRCDLAQPRPRIRVRTGTLCVRQLRQHPDRRGRADKIVAQFPAQLIHSGHLPFSLVIADGDCVYSIHRGSQILTRTPPPVVFFSSILPPLTAIILATSVRPMPKPFGIWPNPGPVSRIESIAMSSWRAV